MSDGIQGWFLRVRNCALPIAILHLYSQNSSYSLMCQDSKIASLVLIAMWVYDLAVSQSMTLVVASQPAYSERKHTLTNTSFNSHPTSHKTAITRTLFVRESICMPWGSWEMWGIMQWVVIKSISVGNWNMNQ